MYVKRFVDQSLPSATHYNHVCWMFDTLTVQYVPEQGRDLVNLEATTRYPTGIIAPMSPFRLNART
jgi:hypothetical protein